jgi:hypothetical protein
MDDHNKRVKKFTVAQNAAILGLALQDIAIRIEIAKLEGKPVEEIKRMADANAVNEAAAHYADLVIDDSW